MMTYPTYSTQGLKNNTFAIEEDNLNSTLERTTGRKIPDH